ncbi:MAG: hypothetical protein EXS59_02455 [Candidatus Taylorbacteria bacterium]|nr:hypothetical protein [Candidatus Taylorbacteria bacterium]
MEKYKSFWSFFYKIWPPCTRVFEKLGFHDLRQRYLLGRLATKCNIDEFQEYLRNKGFHPVELAWRDPGEIFSMRKIDKGIYQFHIRIFRDGEILGHYEYSPESHILKHFLEIGFKPETESFRQILGECLVPVGDKR